MRGAMFRKSRIKLEELTSTPPESVPVVASSRPLAAADWTILAILVVLTLAVFAQITTHAFLNYDDGVFVYENGEVMKGLTPSSIGYALTSARVGWYPLTWLSHELDVTLFDRNAGLHHVTNLLLHLLSSCLLFLALRQMTGASWRSGFVAALFAIHPMHVESVAWIAERRDTLSALFMVLMLLVYARHRGMASGRAQLLVGLCFFLGLASKQMLVTMPFALLLLDVWPLDRASFDAPRRFVPLVREKLGLFVLTAGGIVAAIVGQRAMNAVQSTDTIPLGDRFANAVVAYVRYLAKL